MKPIVSIPEVVPLCGGCPSDWEVYDHLGREVYIRYRFGRLRVVIYEGNEETQCLLSIEHGDPYDGVMSMETMIELTKGVLDWTPHRIHWPLRS